MRRALFTAFIATATCATSISTAASDFGSVKYGTGKVFRTGIFQPKLLATLGGGDEPVLVLSGLGCQECDINLSVYIHPLAQGAMEPGERAPRYTYPGRYHDYMTQALVETVRMFVGRCTPDGKPGVIWFQNSKMESGKWLRSSFNVQVEGAKLIEVRKPPRESSLQAAQAAVSSGSCNEVPGKRFTTEP